MKNILIISLLLLVFITDANSQENTNDHQQTYRKHLIQVLWANTLVPAGKTSHDEDCSIILPTWGINYTYLFSSKWAIAWHNELELQSYVVEEHAESILEREFPYISSLAVVFEPVHRLAIHAGPGYEIEKNESFLIFKAGMEYFIPIGHDYNLSVGFSYDNKRKMYDAWTFGICVGKFLGKKHTVSSSH